MRARDVMTSPVFTVSADTLVSEIAELLLEKRISAVPVVDQNDRVIGLVSEGDLLRRSETGTGRRRSNWLQLVLDRNVSAADFVKTHGSRASDVMSRDVVTVSPDTDLAEIAALLEQRGIKRVPVVENDRILGIVSRANLLHGLVARPNAQRQPETRISDESIRAGINRSVGAIGGVDLSRVNVVVRDGAVFIFGSVKSDIQRRALIIAAEAVPGVLSVTDNLRVNTFPGLAG